MLETNISRPEKQKVGLSTPRLAWELKVCISGMQLVQVPHYSVILLRLTQGAAVWVQRGLLPTFLNPFFFLKEILILLREVLSDWSPFQHRQVWKWWCTQKVDITKQNPSSLCFPFVAGRPWPFRVVEEHQKVCNGWPWAARVSWNKRRPTMKKEIKGASWEASWGTKGPFFDVSTTRR